MSGGRRRPWWKRRWVVALAVLGLGLLVLQQLFFELHQIEGASMWPSYNRNGGAEWVIVAKRGRPEIYEPIVVLDPDQRSVLKRLIARGPAEVSIVEGDVRVGAGYLPRTLDQILETRVPLLTLSDLEFRRRGSRLALVGRGGREMMVPVPGRAGFSLSDQGTHLELRAGRNEAEARCPPGSFHDDHKDGAGRWVEGGQVVRDLIVTFTLYRMDAGAELVIEHWLEPGEQPQARFRLALMDGALRWSLYELGASNGKTLGAGRPPMEMREGLSFRIVMVDQRRVVQARDTGLEEDFRTLEEDQRTVIPGLRESYLKLVVRSGSVILSQLDIDRDIHYTPAPSDEGSGVGKPRTVPDGSLFVLGDNSPESRDSRYWDTLTVAEDVIGRPVLVIWPRSRMRWISSRP